MSKHWRQRSYSGTQWDPEKAICAFCHRKPVATTTSLSSASDVTVDRMRYSFHRSFHNIPVCRRCARQYRQRKAANRFTGILFLLCCVWAFVAAGFAPGYGLERFLYYPPMLAAIIAMLVLGLTNLLQYAAFLYPYQARVEKWLRSPEMWGMYDEGWTKSL
jgi:hypothetical protein